MYVDLHTRQIYDCATRIHCDNHLERYKIELDPYSVDQDFYIL